MKITKISPLTGNENTMELNVTPKEIELWKNGMLIQIAMPNLTTDEREFMISGYTSDDWDKIFTEE